MYEKRYEDGTNADWFVRIKIIKYDGNEIVYDVLSFEFRTNQVSNWIKMKLLDGTETVIHNICVFKTMSIGDSEVI